MRRKFGINSIAFTKYLSALKWMTPARAISRSSGSDWARQEIESIFKSYGRMYYMFKDCDKVSDDIVLRAYELMLWKDEYKFRARKKEMFCKDYLHMEWSNVCVACPLGDELLVCCGVTGYGCRGTWNNNRVDILKNLELIMKERGITFLKETA